MKRQLYTKTEVINFINEGRIMLLSACSAVLDCLPKGNWIGGSSPYFMDSSGGVHTEEKIFVDDFTDIAEQYKISIYNADNIKNIAINSFENGFTLLVIPLDSDTHREFGINSLAYDKIFNNPVVGYVAGPTVDDTQKSVSKVYNGSTNKSHNQEAVAIHIKLHRNQVARAEILNVETINPDSPSIEFPKTSFVQSDCTIDGEPANIADFILENKLKENYLIIANYNGALINRDIKHIDTDKREVSFHSPIFDDETYYLANINDNYQKLFDTKLAERKSNIPYSCSCVSYYLVGNLINKKINMEGVFAFGEIAFQLLNRTLVFLEIDDFS